MSRPRGSRTRLSARKALHHAHRPRTTATSASSRIRKWGLDTGLQTGTTLVGLSHQHELVLLLRFGQGARPATYKQVADALGVLPCAVEQIENDALRLLRQGAVDPLSKGWNGWDEV